VLASYVPVVVTIVTNLRELGAMFEDFVVLREVKLLECMQAYFRVLFFIKVRYIHNHNEENSAI
jgi:hypothetical protein